MAILQQSDHAHGEKGITDPIVTRLAAEDKTKWYKKPNMRTMYIWLFLCCMGIEMTSGFDSSLINNLQFSQPFNHYFGAGLQDSKGKWAVDPSVLGIINASYQLGSIFGVPVAPWFNNRFGRRITILTGSIIMCIGAIIQGFAQHTAMYIIARMILGFGILFAIIAGSALIGELGHPNERAILTSLFNGSYNVGAIIASAIAIATVDIPGDWSWRLPSLLQICPSLLQIATVFLLPESPRWLVSKDRDDEAYAILVKYHAEGDASSVFVQAEMAQIKSTLKLEAEVSKQSWMTMINTPAMRRRVFIAAFLGLFTQMSGNTLLSYYQNVIFEMMGFDNTYAKTRLNISNACWGLVTSVLIAIYVPRFKRRLMFMTSSVLMLSCFIAITVAYYYLTVAKSGNYKNWSASYAALVFWYAYSPAYAIGNNALTYTYLIELFPYAVRTRGIGVEQFFGKGGGFFSIFVNPIAMDAIGWKFFAIYCGWIAFEWIFQFCFYPETQGRTLEELTFLFEDKALADQAVDAVQKQIVAAEHDITVTEVHDATARSKEA